MSRDNSKNSHLHLKAEEIHELEFQELCSVCHVTPEFVMELIAHGTVEAKKDMHFDAHQICVIRTAVRLHQDLDVNHAGIALVMDLLQQIKEMRAELEMFQKYFSTSKQDDENQ